MSAEPSDGTDEQLLWKGTRSLRDLGNDSPGFSLPRGAMRDLDVFDDQTGVDPNRNAMVAVYPSGRVVIDLFPDE